MAYAELHPAFAGLTGTSGGLVFRRLRDKTVVARRAEPSTQRGSAAQQAQRERFALAREYAKAVLADPWQRLAYERLARERHRRADLLVVSDYLNPPTVDTVDVSDYRRQPGGTIRILAHDDVEVVAVEVSIRTAAGILLEQGAATQVHGVWRYRTTVAAPAAEPLTIEAIARDRPGHAGSRRATVS
jgi:hypothetical protein